jgi:hypothetical protein
MRCHPAWEQGGSSLGYLEYPLGTRSTRRRVMCYVRGRGTPSVPRGHGVAAASTGRMCRIGPTVPCHSEQDEVTLLAIALELDDQTASQLLAAAGGDWARMKENLSKKQRQALYNQEQTLRNIEEHRNSERDGRPAPASKVRPATDRAPGQQA